MNSRNPRGFQVVEKEKTDRDAKANELKAKREAQKARIAAMMQKVRLVVATLLDLPSYPHPPSYLSTQVKKRTPCNSTTSSAPSSAPESPEEVDHDSSNVSTTLDAARTALSPISGDAGGD